MQRIESSFEHRGVEMTCSEDILADAWDLGVDLLTLMPNAIDSMLENLQLDTGDFRVRVVINKDFDNPNVVAHDVRVIKV